VQNITSSLPCRKEEMRLSNLLEIHSTVQLAIVSMTNLKRRRAPEWLHLNPKPRLQLGAESIIAYTKCMMYMRNDLPRRNWQSNARRLLKCRVRVSTRDQRSYLRDQWEVDRKSKIDWRYVEKKRSRIKLRRRRRLIMKQSLTVIPSSARQHHVSHDREM
jgi:hypothetical protein